MHSNKKTAPNLTKVQNEQLEKLTTTSSKIRYLDKQNFTRGDISRILNIRYQHVRNVLTQPLKRDN